MNQTGDKKEEKEEEKEEEGWDHKGWPPKAANHVKGGFVQGNRRFPVFPVFWLNLDRSPDRRTNMEQMLIDPIFDNMKKTRISAIDGKDPINLGKYMQIHKKTMTACEYGCTLSHLEAIKQFYYNTINQTDQITNNPCALILEDDVCLDFKPYWKKTLNEIIEEAPQDWEIIQLTYIILGQEPTSMYEKWTTQKNLCSTAAYIINFETASKIINKLYKNGKWVLPNNQQHQSDILIYSLGKTYTYKDCPFIYRAENDSLIHANHVGFHRVNKEKIENMLKNSGQWLVQHQVIDHVEELVQPKVQLLMQQQQQVQTNPPRKRMNLMFT
jgi:GR25 family glycosyltransferase involved in LPS biosynthesis